MKKIILLLLFGSFVLSMFAKEKDLPNIVFILSDDQGWNSLSSAMDPAVDGSKSDFYETPNIDRLMSEGMRFAQSYAPAPVCSPSRHSIQFGISPSKTGVTYNNTSTKQNCDPKLALANLIKKADGRYATAHFGKWHVSFTSKECGYDISDGNTGNKTGNLDTNSSDDPKLVYDLSRRANQFMEERVKVGQPFFIQISHYANHLAFLGSSGMTQKYENKTKGKLHNDVDYAAMNEDLDNGVGMVMSKIKELGIEDNTYIFYTADNGYDESKNRLSGVAQRKAWPLSYSKGFVYEGGVRVPFIVKGPGIEKGTTSYTPVIGYDLMNTFLEIVNPEFEVPQQMEGGSFLGILQNRGKGDVKRQHPFFVFHYPAGAWPSFTAIVKDNYKLDYSWAYDKCYLYHLDSDISEQNDISSEFPKISEELKQLMLSYLDEVNALKPSLQELEHDRNGDLFKKGTGPVSKKKKHF